MITCRVCGNQLFETDFEDFFDWVDVDGGIYCPGKDWDDDAGPYHEPDSV